MMTIQDQQGIWKYERFFPDVSAKNRITLGEGATPLLKIEDIYFKCEYKNPTGSVKDRGLAYQVSKLLENKIKFAVISSSGNAGISAASYCRQAKVKLTVFISPRINRAKFKILKGELPVYLKVSGEVVNNTSNIVVKSAEIAKIPIPQSLVSQYGPSLNNLVEDIVSQRKPHYDIKSLKVEDGKVHFVGSSPDEEWARGKD